MEIVHTANWCTWLAHWYILTDTGLCSEILKYALFPFSALVDDTLMKNKHQISLYSGLKKWPTFLQITFSNGFSFNKLLSVFLSVCLSVPVTPFSLCSLHGIIMKFSGVITNDRSDLQKFKVRGQRSRLQRSKFKVAVSGSLLQFDFTYGDEMMHKAWYRLGAVPYFQGHLSNFKVTLLKNRRFWPKLGVCGQYLQFEFTDGYEMMHEDWNSIEEMPHCVSRSSVKFQGHRARNYQFWPKIGIFWTVTLVRIHRWLLNDAQILK